jgi:hypothetical protein
MDEKKGLKGLLDSKKFWIFLIGLVTEVVIALDVLGIPAENVETLMVTLASITGVGCIGQGIADHGKEKAKVENGGKKK